MNLRASSIDLRCVSQVIHMRLDDAVVVILEDFSIACDILGIGIVAIE